MTLAEFKRSLSKQRPPADLTAPLAALWWAHKDKWDRAHEIVMDASGKDCAWVHAYLHRVEGDKANAGYWYREAGKPVPAGALGAEWTAIVKAMLAKETSR